MDKNSDQKYSLNERFTYVFIPFRVNKNTVSEFGSDLTSQGNENVWECADYHPDYMFRFVTNKIDGCDGTKRCFHYVLRKDDRKIFQKKIIAFPDSPRTASESRWGRYELYIANMEIFCFSTGVGLLIIKVFIDNEDSRYLINATYHLKFAAKTLYCFEDAEKEKFTLLELGKSMISHIDENHQPQFFYYLNPIDDKANTNTNTTAFILNYICKPRSGKYEYELLHLSNAVSDDFLLVQDKNNDIFQISEDVLWQVTDQAAVCIGISQEKESFIKRVLPKNISKSYLFMFTYLLHQKYMLYHLLMQIDTDINNDLKRLEEYQEELVSFKQFFVFSRISDTPQYQKLYEKCAEAFSLSEMYDDVEEPLAMLETVLQKKETQFREQEEARQEKRNRTMDLLLAALGFLGVWSAFVDAGQFGDLINEMLHSSDIKSLFFSHIPHLLFYVLILLLVIFIPIRYFMNRKK